MIDLNPVYLAIVTDILAEHVPTYEVRAFGSRATWTAKDHSDLDLVIIGDEPLPINTMNRLREALEESPLPIRVDVLDWHIIPENWQEEISKNSLEVQETQSVPYIMPYYADKSRYSRITIGEFARLHYGKSLPANKRIKSGLVPVYGSGGITGKHNTALTNGPTVIVGRKGTVGAVYYSPVPCWPIDTTFFISEQDPELLRFKYYALQSLNLESMNSDSAVPGLNRDAAHAREIVVPPLDEQRRIAHILGTLDDRIELNRRMSKTLEEIAQALFRSWFVNFDPVHAKAEGRPSGLPPDLDTLFPSSFQESELGPIPKGWKIKSLDEIAVFTNGLALQRFPPHDDDWLPVIKIAEMKRGYSHNTSKASASIDPKYIVEDGDLLFSWSGSLEIVLWTKGRGALNQHLFKVTSYEFPLWFYRGWLTEHLEHFRQIAASKATTMGHIQRHHLTDTKVVTPPPILLSRSNCYLATLTEQAVCTEVQAHALTVQRDKLLPQLVSGS